jgi:hypothetical protein
MSSVSLDGEEDEEEVGRRMSLSSSLLRLRGREVEDNRRQRSRSLHVVQEFNKSSPDR